MDLQTARIVKQQIRAQVLPELTAPAAVLAFGVPAGREAGPPVSRSVAIGLAAVSADDFKIAVRVQRAEIGRGRHMDAIRDLARGEVDLRYVGRIRKAAGTPLQGRIRPLSIGSSIGHFRITAGTLGCFVESASGVGRTMALSNNHVLADENRGAIGDAILQPGRFDQGTFPADFVATLTNFEPLQTTRPNLVDCAVAELEQGIDLVSGTIPGIGTLQGMSTSPLHRDDIVRKTGRTTATTTGKITAFELDNVIVGYEIGDLRFDDQIEVEGVGELPFSRGGDSGSLVVNQAGGAIGLLFAGGDTGGSNGLGLTYVSPIQAVMNALHVRLVTGA